MVTTYTNRTQPSTTFTNRTALGVIALDVASNSGDNENSTTVTWSHTVSAGLNRILIVGTHVKDDTDVDRPITGITYGGVALTKIREDNDNAKDITVGLWYLVNPSVGTANIVATATGTCQVLTGSAVSLAGVDQDNPVDSQNGTSGNNTLMTIAVTTLNNNNWVIDAGISKEGNDLTIGANQTLLSQFTINSTGGGATDRAVMSYEGDNSPGSITMSWTWSGAEDWAVSAAAFKPAQYIDRSKPNTTFSDRTAI